MTFSFLGQQILRCSKRVFPPLGIASSNAVLKTSSSLGSIRSISSSFGSKKTSLSHFAILSSRLRFYSDKVGADKGEQVEAKSSEGGESSSSNDEKKKKDFFEYNNYVLGGLALAGGLTYYYLGSNDLYGAFEPAKPENNIIYEHNKRVMTNIKKGLEELFQPPSKKLLPDPLPAQYQQPYTLVINLEKFLIYQAYDGNRNVWRNYLRPDAELFLYNMIQHFEVVVYSSMPADSGHAHINTIDPTNELVRYRLYRDSNEYRDGVYVKDISWLNRDMSKVIYVDADETAPVLHPENTIKVKPWTADPETESEDQLDSLVMFLQRIAYSNVPDVRPVIKSYEGKGDIINAYLEQERNHFNSTLAERRALQGLQKGADTMKKIFGLGRSTSQPGAVSKPSSAVTFEEYRQNMRLAYTEVLNFFKPLVQEQVNKQKALIEEYMETYPQLNTINQLFDPPPTFDDFVAEKMQAEKKASEEKEAANNQKATSNKLSEANVPVAASG